MLIKRTSEILVGNFLSGRITSSFKYTIQNMSHQVPECVFCRICNGQDPTEIVYQVRCRIKYTLCNNYCKTFMRKLSTAFTLFIFPICLFNIKYCFK